MFSSLPKPLDPCLTPSFSWWSNFLFHKNNRKKVKIPQTPTSFIYRPASVPTCPAFSVTKHLLFRLLSKSYSSICLPHAAPLVYLWAHLSPCFSLSLYIIHFPVSMLSFSSAYFSLLSKKTNYQPVTSSFSASLHMAKDLNRVVHLVSDSTAPILLISVPSGLPATPQKVFFPRTSHVDKSNNQLFQEIYPSSFNTVNTPSLLMYFFFLLGIIFLVFLLDLGLVFWLSFASFLSSLQPIKVTTLKHSTGTFFIFCHCLNDLILFYASDFHICVSSLEFFPQLVSHFQLSIPHLHSSVYLASQM